MQEYNPEIDQITKEVTILLEKLANEYGVMKISTKSDYLKGTAWISFHLGREYFMTARDSLNNGRVIGGGAIVRTCIENVADLFYIFDKKNNPNKYARAYVESLEKFRQVMLNAADLSFEEVFDERRIKQANKWTNASIEDRIVATGKGLSNIYDLFSYFSHPNPGSLTYLMIKSLKEKQINLLKQGNCLTALNLMGLVLGYADLKSVTIDELDKLARKLGSQMIPDNKL